MELKPQSFFVGVVDFFAVWLPGAILTWFLVILFYDASVAAALKIPGNTAVQVVFFLLVTYLVGNILFGFSSLLDNLYDKKLRKSFRTKDKNNFDLELKTASAIRNSFINVDEWIMKHRDDGQLTNDQVEKLYSKPYRYIINTYKWSQHYLLFKNTDALADVKRLEADSKFFRSLVITFIILAVILFCWNVSSLMNTSTRIIAAFSSIVLALVSLYLFSNYRYKATVRAYELMIAHYYLHPVTPTADGITQRSKISTPAIAKKTSSSVIKSDLTAEFAKTNQKILEYLPKGIPGTMKHVRIAKGEMQNTFFTANADEYWYCLKGNGTMTVKDGETETLHFLQPNAIVPAPRGRIYSFNNNQNKNLELLVINQGNN